MADVLQFTFEGNAAGLVGAVNQAEASLNRLESAAQKSSGVLGSVFSGIGQGVGIAAGLAGINGIAGAMGAVGSAAIGMNSKLEQAQIGFTSMLGSGEKASAFLKDLQQFANTTPFEFPGLLTAAQRMLAFGFEAKQVKPLLTAVGSAAAAMGAGQSGIDRITMALGQMKAATVVQAGELNQLTEAGVPAFDLLAKAMGVSTGEVKKLVEQGKIASDVFITAFQEWANANFGDMMEKQSHTFEGAMSTIHDTLISTGARAFQPFFALVSQGADTIAQFTQTATFTGWADAVAGTITDVVRQLGDAFRTVQQVIAGDWSPDASKIEPFANMVGIAAVAVRDFLHWIGGLPEPVKAAAAGFATTVAAAGPLSGILFAATAAVAAVGAGLAFLISPLGLVAAGVGLLAAAWTANWGDIQGKTAEAWAAIEPTFTALVDWLGTRIPVVLDWISSTGWPMLVSAGQAVADWIMGTAVPAFQTVVTWLGTNIPPAITWITETGWPALVSAGTTVATFITGTLIPGVTSLIDWLGPKLMPVVTWISDTGWPALVAAGALVGTTITTITTFFQGLYVELDKRGVFSELATIWDTLTAAGNLVWGMVQTAVGWWQKLHDALLPVQADVGALVGAGMLTKLSTDMAAVGTSAQVSVSPIQAIGAGIQFMVGQVTAILAPIAAFQKALADLKTLIENFPTMPSFSLPSIPGTGTTGAQTLSNVTAPGGTHASAYMDLINKVSAEENEDPALVAAIMDTEGSGAGSTSPAGARGLMQVMPNYVAPGENPFDPETSIRQGIRAIKEKRRAVGNDPADIAGAYFGYGTDAGGMTTGGYRQRFQQNYNRYRSQPTAAPGPMVKTLPPGTTGIGGPASETGPGGAIQDDPKVLQWIIDHRPVWDSAMADIKATGTDTFTTVGTVSKAQALILSGSQTDALGNVTRVYHDASGDIITTTTDVHGQVIAQYATLAGGVKLQMGDLAAGVTTTQTQLGNDLLTTVTGTAGTYVSTITDMAGQIVSQYAGTADATIASSVLQSAGVLTNINLMATGSQQFVQQMSDGQIATTAQMGNTIVTTITTMTGQVVDQYATLADGTMVRLTDLGTQSTSIIDAMAGTITTTVTGMSGAVIQTVTDMGGQVIAQTVTTGQAQQTIWTETSAGVVATATQMGAQVIGQSRLMGDNVVTAIRASTGQMQQLVTTASGQIVGTFKTMADSVGRTVVAGLDVAVKGFDTLTGAMKKSEDQAKKTQASLEELAKHQGGEKSGEGDSSKYGKNAKGGGFKAAGGSVFAHEAYLVGEQGPELFLPNTSGTIVPNGQISAGGSPVGMRGAGIVISGDITIVVNGADRDPRQIAEEVRSELIGIGRRNAADPLSSGS